jgi:hypothetical protein
LAFPIQNPKLALSVRVASAFAEAEVSKIQNAITYPTTVNPMEDFTRYFMGETLGNLTVNSWKWLWGMPPAAPETAPTSDDIIIEDLTRSIAQVKLKVMEMQNTVDRVRLSTQTIQRQYQLKCRSHRELIKISFEFKSQGNIVEARSVMAQVIQLEQFLPKLKERWKTSQGMLTDIQEIYAQKSAELSLLGVDLEMVKTQRDMNNSIGIDSSPDLTTIQEKLQGIRAEVEDRYHQIQAEIQLSNSSNCELGKTFNTQDIDARIENLKNIDGSSKN